MTNDNKKKNTWGVNLVSPLGCLLILVAPAQAAVNPVSYEITVSATIGEPKLTVFGWTSPAATVELSGQQVFERGKSNESGWFYFDRVFLPSPKLDFTGKLTYPEICLTSIDLQNRSSFPTCLPSLPTRPLEIKVGPVLLPPSLTLTKGDFLPFEQAVAQGTTIPNAKVFVYLANDQSSEFSLIKPVMAYSLPKYELKADSQGNFEFNLPNRWRFNSQDWRVFAGVEFEGNFSPKSNTLKFTILSWWAWFWLIIKKMIFLLFNWISPYLWLLIVGTEIVVLALIIKKQKCQKN